MTSTSRFVSQLRTRCFSPDYSVGETDATEYHLVRVLVLTERAEKAYREIYDAEDAARLEMTERYKDATFDLKWRHRQRQLEDRRQHERRHVDGMRGLEALEAAERQDMYEAAVRHYGEALELHEHRRRERIAQQTVTIRTAIQDHADSERGATMTLDHADERDVLCREEQRGRGAIADAEDSAARQRLWTEGVLALQQRRIAGFQERGRERLAQREQDERSTGLRLLQQGSVIVNAETFYRAKIEGYEEPRRRDAIMQRSAREMDFVCWQLRAQGHTTKWAGEQLAIQGRATATLRTPSAASSRPAATVE
jgi:hypothetical protein